MKYTISGLQQYMLIDLGLDCIDALIIRYVYDFYTIGKMTLRTDRHGNKFFWMSYQKLLDDLPILNMKKRALANRFKKYVEVGLLYSRIYHENKYKNQLGEIITRRGVYTYFSFDEERIQSLLNPLNMNNTEK